VESRAAGCAWPKVPDAIELKVKLEPEDGGTELEIQVLVSSERRTAGRP
jgi:hypothetical protein